MYPYYILYSTLHNMAVCLLGRLKGDRSARSSRKAFACALAFRWSLCTVLVRAFLLCACVAFFGLCGDDDDDDDGDW